MKKIATTILLAFFATACATNSKTRWALMGAAVPVGGAIGYSTAPDDEKPESHAFLWSAVFVSAAAIIGNYYFSDDKELEKLKAEANKPNFELVTEKEGKFYVPTGKVGEYSKGKYKVKKIDQWIDEGPNAKVHQDMRLELVIPNDKKEGNSEK